MPSLKEYGQQYAQQYGVDFGLLDRLINQESKWNHYDPRGQVLTSSAGAKGVAQLMPGTAQGLGVDWRNPLENLRGGVMYLAQNIKRYGGDIVRGVAAYNAGPGNIDAWDGTRAGLRKVVRGGKTYDLKETETYLDAILPGWTTGSTKPGQISIDVPGVGPIVIDNPLAGIPSPNDIGSGIVSGITSSIKNAFYQTGSGVTDFGLNAVGAWAGLFLFTSGIALAALRSEPGKAAVNSVSLIPGIGTGGRIAAGAVSAVAEGSAKPIIRTVPSRSVTVRNVSSRRTMKAGRE